MNLSLFNSFSELCSQNYNLEKIIPCNKNFDIQSSEFWFNKPFNLIFTFQKCHNQ